MRIYIYIYVFPIHKNRRYAFLRITFYLKYFWHGSKSGVLLLMLIKHTSSLVTLKKKNKYKISFNNTDLPSKCKYPVILQDEGLIFDQQIHTTRNTFQVAKSKLSPLLSRKIEIYVLKTSCSFIVLIYVPLLITVVKSGNLTIKATTNYSSKNKIQQFG